MGWTQSPKTWFASTSLFARLLLVMFATVVIAQAITFALVVAMPTPAQPVTRIGVIASVLRTGVSDTPGLRVALGAEPHDNMIDPAERTATAQLAAALGVGHARVRVVRIREPRGGGRPVRAGASGAGPRLMALPTQDGPGQAPAIANAQAEEIVGSFEAGLRLADGSWRVATFGGAPIARWQWEVLLWLLGSVVAVAPLAWWLARRIAGPIAAFADTARRIGANPSVAPMALAGPPEITRATHAVNEMQTRILRFVEERTTMMGAMAHDLRTPLMRLSLRLQKAPEELREASLRDIEEIEEMTRGTLAFARDTALPGERHRIALWPLLETIAEDFADRGHDVAVLADGDATVSGDLAAIKRMVNNLVGNAVAYAGNARIALESEARHAIITVSDEGPGIPPGDLDRVFDPFYRVEKSRNRNTGGAGLGLASVRALARAHGGEVILANRPEGGVLATVSLPL